PVAVDLIQIRKAAEKVAPIRATVHRLESSQGRVEGVRILVKARSQPIRIEGLGARAGLLVFHNAVHEPTTNRSSSVTTAEGFSMWALCPASGISWACDACVRNSCRDTIGSRSPRASRTRASALDASDANGAPATEKVRGSCARRQPSSACRTPRPSDSTPGSMSAVRPETRLYRA